MRLKQSSNSVESPVRRKSRNSLNLVMSKIGRSPILNKRMGVWIVATRQGEHVIPKPRRPKSRENPEMGPYIYIYLLSFSPQPGVGSTRMSTTGGRIGHETGLEIQQATRVGVGVKRETQELSP